MTTPLGQTQAHKLTIEALQLITTAKALLHSAHNEPSVDITEEELALIRAAKQAEASLNDIVFSLARRSEHDALPSHLQRALRPQSGADLLEALREDTPATVFDRR